MKAEELRIGNWVFDQDGDETQIEELSPVLKHGEYRWQWLNNLNPIPITEEWLVKFGFEFDIFYQKHTNGTLCVYWVDKICLVSWCKAHREDILRYEYPKYVHELQNLVFALTGNELTIK